MKTFRARYALHNGQRGTLTCIAASSCDAVLRIFDAFGDQLRSVSVRPAA